MVLDRAEPMAPSYLAPDAPALAPSRSHRALAEAINDGIAGRSVGFAQVISVSGGLTETHTFYASPQKAFLFVLTDALSTIGERMLDQRRALSDLLPHEYTKYVIKLYSAPDRTTSIMSFIDTYSVGDIAYYLKITGLNFDEVLDDPMLIADCLRPHRASCAF